jgi:tetratricopeptide (TPR) repeat protein
MMLGQWEAARDLFAQAATDLNALSHKEEAAAFLGVGDAEFALENTESAIAGFRAANNLYRQFGFADGEAKALLGLAILASYQDHPGTATEAFLRAGILFSKAKDTLSAARTLVTFASFLSQTDDIEGALQMYREAIPILDQESAPAGKILAALGTGDLNRQTGRDADAATAYLQANDWFAEMEFPVAEANRHLGFPAVEAISIRNLGDGVDPYDMAPAVEPEPGTVIDSDLLGEENLAKFPNQNAQARALVADLKARITEAMAFVTTLN